MAKTVKGQQTLDNANARQNQEEAAKKPRPPVDVAMVATFDAQDDAQRLSDAIHTVMTPGSGFTKPKSLAALESIVESNVHKGAALWRKAADALLGIKRFKLWKNAEPTDGGGGYTSFVDYAERRFGFKKTYAYDLVKAAQRKPEALTEGEARAEMKEERGTKPVTVNQWPDKFRRIWTRFEDAAGDLRDRVSESEDSAQFIEAYDALMSRVGPDVLDFLDYWTPVEGAVVDPEADSQKPVTPLREDNEQTEREAAVMPKGKQPKDAHATL